MIVVFLEDIWEEIITKRGFKLLKEKGIKLEGNIFKNRPRKLADLKRVNMIVATNPNLAILSWAKNHRIPAIFYALFPDLILGWDYKSNCFKNLPFGC